MTTPYIASKLACEGCRWKQLPRLFCPSPGPHVENLWTLLHSRPATWWQTVQTSCRTRNERRQHECHSGECRGKGVDAVYEILTLDIQARASGKWAVPCSTRYRATSPWSASSYNLRFYTGGSSHALNIKEKERMRKVPLRHSFSIYSLHVKTHSSLMSRHVTFPIPTTHTETYPPWRISYLVQTYSTWPRRWSCPHSVPGETCKRQYSGLNPALYPVMVLYYLTR